MPALVKRRFGESGRSEELGTMVWFFSWKKSRNCWRIWALVGIGIGWDLGRDFAKEGFLKREQILRIDTAEKGCEN